MDCVLDFTHMRGFMAASKTCQFQANCPLHTGFRDYQKSMYVSLYCSGHYELCARYRRRLKGEDVPANLAPSGLFFLKER